MTFIAAAVITAGSSLAAGAYGARQARKGAKEQSAAADRATELQREIAQQQREDIEPFRLSGISAQNRLMQLLGIGGDATAADYGMLTRGFGEKDLQMDPGYGFRLREGEKALERMQSARGGGQGLLSGAVIKAGQRYGQDYASQEYQNAFNRMFNLNQQRIGALTNLYGGGQSATQLLSGQAGQYGENVGNLLMAGGAARASGYAGVGNALNQALGQYINYTQGQDVLKYLKG